MAKAGSPEELSSALAAMMEAASPLDAALIAGETPELIFSNFIEMAFKRCLDARDGATLQRLARIRSLICLCRAFRVDGCIYLNLVAPDSELSAISAHLDRLPPRELFDLADQLQIGAAEQAWIKEVPTLATAWRIAEGAPGLFVGKIAVAYLESVKMWTDDIDYAEILALSVRWIEILASPHFVFLPPFSQAAMARTASVLFGAVVHTEAIGTFDQKQIDTMEFAMERSTSNLKPDQPALFPLYIDLAALYRFLINSDLEHSQRYVERGIELLTGAKDLLKDQPRRTALQWLADFYGQRFNTTKNLDDLTASISTFETYSREFGSSEMPDESLITLASAHLGRFALSRAVEDLDAALTAAAGVKAVSMRDAQKEVNRILRSAHEWRFDLLDRLEDCDAAIAATEAATGTSDDLDQAASYRFDKAKLLLKRHRVSRSPLDLDRAIKTFSGDWQFMISDAGKRLDIYTTWANALRIRFEVSGRLDDLRAAAELLENEIGDVESGKPRSLFTLAVIFQRLSARTGDRQLLVRSIAMLETAIALAPEEDVPGYLQSLAHGYGSRFSDLGDSADLQKAVELLERTLQMIAPSDRDRPQYLESLAGKLVDLFNARGSFSDLVRGVAAMRDSVALTSSEDHDAAGRWYNLGIFLTLSYKHSENIELLHEAIEHLRRASAPRYRDSPFYADWLSGHANALAERFEALEDEADINSAIEDLKEALELTPIADDHYGYRLANLGSAYLAKISFVMPDQNRAEDLDRCVDVAERGCKHSNPSRPDWGLMLNNLGAALYRRFLTLRGTEDHQNAIDYLRRGTEASNNAHATIYAVKNWMNLASADKQWADVVDAFQHLGPLRRRLVAANPSRELKARWLREMQGMGTLAAVACVELGRLKEAAIALEETQAILLNEVLDYRPIALNLLQDSGHDALVSEFNTVSQAWRELNSAVMELPIGDHQTPAQLVKMSEANSELDRIVHAIRQVPGHGNFLTANAWQAIERAVARVGTMAYAVAASEYGFILLFNNGRDSPRLIRLPLLTVDEFANKSVPPDLSSRAFAEQESATALSEWDAAAERFAAWFWEAAVTPILESLDGRVPITLIPIGRLIGAPWTSAYGVSARRRSYLVDHLSLRLAPTARVLSSVERSSERAGLDLLAVSASGSSPAQALKYAGAELAAVQSGVAKAKVLTGEDATRAAIVAQLPNRTALHFCCHGSADPIEPLSSFLLVGGGERLTMRDILSVRLDNLDIVTLSACETGVHGDALPDEAMGLASAILAAGSRACIATSWPVPDLASAMLIYRFHSEWRFSNIRAPDALNRAQVWLRDTTNDEKYQYFMEESTTAGAHSCEAALEFLMALAFQAPHERGCEPPRFWAGFAFYGFSTDDQRVGQINGQ
ncbi:CHAT domain-containing protein [Rhizobium leguminosarum bv. viciae]|nr:CHAT domain-containing protein [Rhizobium leguminosarum bv. viciae]